MPKWVCFKLKKHVSLVRCCPHPKLVSPDKLHSHILRLAKYAGKTPDIVTENTTNVDTMHGTLSNTTSKKINLKRGPDIFHMIPKVRSNVRIFWADKNGTTKHNDLRKRFYENAVIALLQDGYEYES